MQGKNRIIVSEKGKKRILSGHRWIFRSDITEDKSGGSDLVCIYDSRGHFLATALHSKDSQIALRTVSTEEVRNIDEHINISLLNACEYRKSLNLSGDCMRIVHSESDNLPGLIVDKYSDTIVFQILTRPMENLKDIIIRKIAEIMNPVQIFEKNDTTTRQIEKLPVIVKTVYGKERQIIFCSENHHMFLVNLVNSQKTGEFLDQKVNRYIVGQNGGGRVLDLFCYHGWFGCNIKNYDELILADSSEAALKIAEKNMILNQKKNYLIKEANVFDLLRELDKRGERFTTIILDPPGFIKSRKDIKNGYAGYKEINLRAMKILSQDGILATFSCSYYMSDEEFLNMLREAAQDAKTEFIVREYLRQAPDHRELLGFPESHYLKGFILQKVNKG
ncbi:MAG: class I SAM-dependent rRNA methyltransferase [Deltaproteobacteria bacterium]|nr:class I SAM-dependent rRNA methyltransferase [Deltaproteobacteria bacterium]